MFSPHSRARAAICDRFPLASLTPQMPAKRRRRLGQQIKPRARGHVVEDHRQIDAFGHRRIVRDQSGLRGLVVIGRDQQQRVRAHCLRLTGQLDRAGRVVCARAHDDGAAPLTQLGGAADERFAFPCGQRRRFARRAADNQRVCSRGDLPLYQIVVCRPVHLAAAKRRYQRRAQSPEKPIVHDHHAPFPLHAMRRGERKMRAKSARQENSRRALRQ